MKVLLVELKEKPLVRTYDSLGFKHPSLLTLKSLPEPFGP
jgi:hypothetical protein